MDLFSDALVEVDADGTGRGSGYGGKVVMQDRALLEAFPAVVWNRGLDEGFVISLCRWHVYYQGYGTGASGSMAGCTRVMMRCSVCSCNACPMRMRCPASTRLSRRVGMVRPRGWVRLVEVAHLEKPAQYGPGEGEVGDEDGGGGLTNVPVDPGCLVRVSEAVVAV